jgi:hypothetical protein
LLSQLAGTPQIVTVNSGDQIILGLAQAGIQSVDQPLIFREPQKPDLGF